MSVSNLAASDAAPAPHGCHNESLVRAGALLP